MTINLMPYLIIWAALTTIVLGLALWRLLEGLHDDTSLHVIEGTEQELEAKQQAGRRMDRIEVVGKALTVLSGVMITGIGVAYLYNMLAMR
jgi:hypothetical protein